MSDDEETLSGWSADSPTNNEDSTEVAGEEVKSTTKEVEEETENRVSKRKQLKSLKARG